MASQKWPISRELSVKGLPFHVAPCLHPVPFTKHFQLPLATVTCILHLAGRRAYEKSHKRSARSATTRSSMRSSSTVARATSISIRRLFSRSASTCGSFEMLLCRPRMYTAHYRQLLPLSPRSCPVSNETARSSLDLGMSSSFQHANPEMRGLRTPSLPFHRLSRVPLTCNAQRQLARLAWLRFVVIYHKMLANGARRVSHGSSSGSVGVAVGFGPVM